MPDSIYIDSGGNKDIQGVYLISPTTDLPVEPSSGGGATVATVDNIVMQDTDGTLFFKRVTSDTPPVLTNWKLSDGTAYTITGTPVPYVVSTTNIEGNVEITNDVGNDIPISAAQIGEVQAIPTANTVLDRLKALLTSNASLIDLFPTALSNGFFQVSIKESISTVLETGTAWFGKVIIGDGTNTVAVETTGTDATSNTQNNITATVRLKVFNGTTWDRVRSAQTAVSSAFTGFLSVLPWSVYKTSPTTRTDGQGGALLSDSLGNLLVNNAVKVTKTNRSGTIVAGEVAQSLMATNTARQGWQIQNISNGDLWFNETGSTAVLNQPSFRVPANGYYGETDGQLSTAAISIIGATTGQAYTAREW